MGIFGWGKKKQPADDEEPQAVAAEQVEESAEDAEESGREPEAEPEVHEAAEAEVEEVAQEAEPVDEAAEPEEPPAPEPPDSEEKSGGLFGGLAKTRKKFSGLFTRITPGRKIDDELLDELEEELVTADLGVATAMELIDKMRAQVARKELDNVDALKASLRSSIAHILERALPPTKRDNHPHVIMVVGVNGVGKTTTIGKLAKHFQAQGKSVLLAAGDTFRAAAGEQLTVWADRVGCEIVGGQHGADPSAVAFDAVEAAVARGVDLAIVDTAGRLHTQTNLMEELKKVHRVIGKRLDGAPHEVLLVLDATTGQNALSQAKLFNQSVPLTGFVLTKLDGTAKGGVVVGIAAEMELPICFVGVGEKIDDLKPFDSQEFALAIV